MPRNGSQMACRRRVGCCLQPSMTIRDNRCPNAASVCDLLASKATLKADPWRRIGASPTPHGPSCHGPPSCAAGAVRTSCSWTRTYAGSMHGCVHRSGQRRRRNGRQRSTHAIIGRKGTRSFLLPRPEDDVAVSSRRRPRIALSRLPSRPQPESGAHRARWSRAPRPRCRAGASALSARRRRT
jgi:hypothetical protein